MMPTVKQAPDKARRMVSESIASYGERTEASRNSGRALGAYAAYLAYWLLTLIANSDAAFVVSRTVRLPLLGVAVPLDLYFFVIPLLGLLTFLAFQSYLRSLADSVPSGGLEGRPAASTRRSPWLAASFFGPSRFATRNVGRRAVAVMFWASLPAALVYHFLRFIRIHEFAAAYVLGGLVVAVTLVVAGCWWTRPGRPAARPLLWTGVAALAFLGVLACQTVMVIGLIPLTAKGYYPGSFSPRLLRNFLQPFLSMNLTGLDLTAADFVPGSAARPRGLSLRGVHLEGARLHLTRARDVDFQLARMKEAVVDSCDLEGANFRMADLTETYFLYSDLARADLTSTGLRGGMFFDCELKGSSFRYAALSYCKLYYCEAGGADFRLANFDGAGYVFYTNFEAADLEGVNFRNCHIVKSIFARADLKEADFRDSELWKTDFSGADLEGANFLGAFRLEVEQLFRARTLYRAKLDPPLYGEIMKRYPKLLQKPVEPGSR